MRARSQAMKEKEVLAIAIWRVSVGISKHGGMYEG